MTSLISKRFMGVICKLMNWTWKKNITYELWEKGVSYELEFWDTWLQERGGEWRDDYWNRLDPNLPLQDSIVQILDCPVGVDVKILDVGAGPLTLLGKKWEGRRLQITATDPLANGYDQLLEKHRIEPLVRTQYADAENLTGTFAADTFDLVYAQNSIDHCYNPIEAISQMLAVVKQEHWVILAHNICEGRKEQYVGFHQWDFFAREGDFMIQSQAKTYNVTEELQGRAQVQVKIIGNQWITVKIRKKTKLG